MRELRMPKLNNNDDSYILVEWCVSEAQQVATGDVIATVETSKANEDLVAEEDGVLHQLHPEGTECPVGGLVGYLFDSEQDRLTFASAAPPPTDTHHDLVITAPAQALMRELGLSHDDLRGLSSNVVKRADVERIASRQRQRAEAPAPSAPAAPVGETHRQSRNQQAVAAVVTRSHATIPSAFAAVDVVDDVARAARRAHGASGGVTPLLLKALGAVRATHPLFFGDYRGADGVIVSEGAHVAVTFDVGHGLYLPVVQDVQHRSVFELTEALDQLRAKARTGAFTEADLSGANIGLSLHTYQGVVAAHPLITPGQVVMLSLCANRPELALDRNGAIVSRSVFQLGIAYDHRVVNGRDAVAFLRAIKSHFERADWVEALLQR